MARTLRTEAKLDPKQQLSGTLYSRTALEVARKHADAMQRLDRIAEPVASRRRMRPRPALRRVETGEPGQRAYGRRPHHRSGPL